MLEYIHVWYKNCACFSQIATKNDSQLCLKQTFFVICKLVTIATSGFFLFNMYISNTAINLIVWFKLLLYLKKMKKIFGVHGNIL